MKNHNTKRKSDFKKFQWLQENIYVSLSSLTFAKLQTGINIIIKNIEQVKVRVFQGREPKEDKGEMQ